MDLFDVLALIGIVLLGVGLWLMSPALSLTVVGSLMLAIGLVGAYGPRRSAKRGKG